MKYKEINPSRFGTVLSFKSTKVGQEHAIKIIFQEDENLKQRAFNNGHIKWMSTYYKNRDTYFNTISNEALIVMEKASQS